MKAKPTQKEVVRLMLIDGQKVTGSTAHKFTKAYCTCATLNLHKLLSSLRDDGYVVKSKWVIDGHLKFKEHELDLKKTPKNLLKKSK